MSTFRWVLAAAFLGAVLYALFEDSSDGRGHLHLPDRGESTQPTLGSSGAPDRNTSLNPQGGTKADAPAVVNDSLALVEGIPSSIGLQVEAFAATSRQAIENVSVQLSVASDTRVVTVIAEGVTDKRGRCRLGPFTVPRVPRESLQSRSLLVTLASSAGVSKYAIRPIVLQRQAVRQRSTGKLAAGSPMWVIMRYPHPVGYGVAGRVVSGLGHPPARAYVRMLEASGWVLCDEHGNFDLRVAEPGVHTLEVVVGLPGGVQEPLRQPVSVTHDMKPIVVKLPGVEAVSGVVVNPEGTPVSDIQLILAPEEHRVRSTLGPSSIPRSPAPTPHLVVHTSAAGAFHFVGVKPAGRYRIWWRADDGQMESHPEAIPSGAAKVRVVCRRHRLHVELRDARSNKILRGDAEVLAVNGGSVPGAFPVVESFWRRGDSGFCSPAGSRLTLRASARGYQTATQSVQMPDKWSHTHVIRLHPSTAAGVTLLTCLDDHGRHLSNVPLQVLAPGSRRPLPVPVEWRSRVARIDGLEPGEHEFSTRSPLGSPTDKHWHLFRPSRIKHVVLKSEVSGASLTIPLGGAIRLKVRLAQRKEAPATLRLVGEGGQILPVIWYVTGEKRMSRWWQGTPLADAMALVSPALTPAEYELHVGTDGRTRVVPIPVLRGEITEERIEIGD